MQCKYCGKEFKNRKHKKVDGKWLDQIYCNIECYNKDKAARRYICENCGIVFAPANSHPHRFCSPACMKEFNNKSKEATAERKRQEKLESLITKECEWCGKEFTTNLSNKKYCCQECCTTARKEKQKVTPIQKVCIVCGKTFETPKKTTCCCSPECSRKHKRKTRHGRHRKYYYDIFQRDNGTCQLCGRPIQEENKMLFGTLDHIEPRSLGGGDEPSNLRLTHFLCNLLRSNNQEINYIDPSKLEGYLGRS